MQTVSSCKEIMKQAKKGGGTIFSYKWYSLGKSYPMLLFGIGTKKWPFLKLKTPRGSTIGLIIVSIVHETPMVDYIYSLKCYYQNLKWTQNRTKIQKLIKLHEELPKDLQN